MIVKPHDEELDLSKIKGGMAIEPVNGRAVCQPYGNVHNECLLNGKSRTPDVLNII